MIHVHQPPLGLEDESKLLVRVHPKDFDLPFSGHPSKWEWTEENIGQLAVLFRREFEREDLVVACYEITFVEWALAYRDTKRLPILAAPSPAELGALGLTYLAGYRNGRSLLDEQGRWIKIARLAMESHPFHSPRRAM